MNTNQVQLIRFLVCIAVFLSFNLNINAQIQKGLDIDGEDIENRSGISVSMPDAITVAIGADFNSGNGIRSGHARVYSWNGNVWIQKGQDIDGEAAYDYSGKSVCMPDPNTVAIGAASNDGNGSESGHVRIYTWNGTIWIQKGQDIDGEAAYDYSGTYVCMPDSNTVAIGAILNDGNGNNSGHARIFSWDGIAWIQKGMDIDGEAAGDNFGEGLDMPDANTISIGARLNDGNGLDAGHVRIFIWNGSSWVQKGTDIEGDNFDDNSGVRLSMPDPNTIAIGAEYNDGNGTSSGQIRVFKWDTNINAWIQKGTDIYGEASGDLLTSVSMADSNTLTASASFNDGNGTNSGHVRIYKFTNGNWAQMGIDIDGEAAYDNSGVAISMPDTNTVAIGAYGNDGNGNLSGHVRIYGPLNASTNLINTENNLLQFVKYYPNPTLGDFEIYLNYTHKLIYITIINELGQEIQNEQFSDTDLIHTGILGKAGLYFIEVNADNKFYVFTITKK